MLPRLSDVKHSVILPSVFAISSAVTHFLFFQECDTPPSNKRWGEKAWVQGYYWGGELLLVNYKASTSRVCEQRHSPTNNDSNRVRHRRPTGIGKQHWSLESTNSDDPKCFVRGSTVSRQAATMTTTTIAVYSDPRENDCLESVVILTL